jgi:membrane protease YdiL (CAAX protease family)
MTRLVRLHPLSSFFVLACAIFWACIAVGFIDRFRFWVPILGAFAPGVAAIIVLGLGSGEPGVRALLGKLARWRVGFGWYLVALGLPLAEDALAAGLAYLRGSFSAARLPPVLPIVPAMWVLFLFAAGEELGWRGFALPRLIGSHSAIGASLMVGTLHAVWHWPVILLPHQYLSGVPLLPWSVFVLAEAILFTWISTNTGGSVLMCALYHGCSNLGMILYSGIDPALAPWFKCSVSVLVALGVVAWAGPDLSRTQAPMRESRPSSA